MSDPDLFPAYAGLFEAQPDQVAAAAEARGISRELVGRGLGDYQTDLDGKSGPSAKVRPKALAAKQPISAGPRRRSALDCFQRAAVLFDSAALAIGRFGYGSSTTHGMAPRRDAFVSASACPQQRFLRAVAKRALP